MTLVFQEKFYRRTGAANAQIRDELLRDLIADRAEEFDRLNLEMFCEKSKTKRNESTFDDASLSEPNPPAKAEEEEDLRDDFQRVLDDVLARTVETTDEFRREKEFLAANARRQFRKKNTFHCDVCSVFLLSDKLCEQVKQPNGREENLSVEIRSFVAFAQRRTSGENGRLVSVATSDAAGNDLVRK